MKTVIFLVAMLGIGPAFAQDKAPAKAADEKQSHIQMHEEMAKAHQQAADCLKSGKSQDECRKGFHDMCGDASGSDRCGPWMMHHKMGRKSK